MNAYAQLKIGIPSISESLNHLEIHSVSEYVIFDDLLRSLIKFDSNGELAPDLAESWEIKENYKKFILKIRPNQHFSDNSLITAKEVEQSLLYLSANPNIVHGDGNKIKKISLLNNNQIEIELFESNPFFLTELSNPEYRIVKTIENKYNVTSGPYFIKNTSSSKKLSLKLNEHYPFETNVKFKEVDYIPYQKISKNELENLDIIWPAATIESSEIENIIKHGYYVYKLNLGFSYWLSLNPNTLNKDERIQIKLKLDPILKSSLFFSNNNLSRSKQLFLPYGPGRLTDEQIESIDRKLENKASHKLKKVKILLPKNIQNELLMLLKSSFDHLDIHLYSDFSEYSRLIKQQKYDISLVNNDLSSIDLRSSLIVTFNTSRPLVWIDQNDRGYTDLLKNINTELNSIKRYTFIKQLGENLLNDVIVYPLYYDYGFVFAKKGIDLSQLNKSGAETFSWKIK
jgi:ABC-type transport system substrate-binding protein